MIRISRDTGFLLKGKFIMFWCFIPYNKSFIGLHVACSVKIAGYWPRSFLACVWTSTSSRPINTQTKNFTNNPYVSSERILDSVWFSAHLLVA